MRSRLLILAFIACANPPAANSNFEIRISRLLGGVVAQEKKKDDDKTKDNKALKDAAAKGDKDKLLAMIKKGADVNWRDPADYGKTALVRAIFTKKVEIVKILLENGADINYPDGSGRYPVYFCHISSVEMLNFVLSKGGDKDINREPGMLGSLCAHGNGPPEMITILVKAGADPDRLYMHKTPLVAAIEKGRPDYVKVLIEAKADVNWKDRKGITTLQHALTKGNAEIIEMLKKAGAKQ